MIGENTVPTAQTATVPSKGGIPHATAEKFSAIPALTDAFCERHLDDDYLALTHRVIGSLARKRPSPLLKGKESVWAAAVVHAAGRVNFLDDPSQVPHCKPKVIYEFFGIAESTGQNESKEVRQLLGMGPMSPEWTLPSQLAHNPLVWIVKVNGLAIDIRNAPIELQRFAYEKGLIPYIPAEPSATAPTHEPDPASRPRERRAEGSGDGSDAEGAAGRSLDELSRQWAWPAGYTPDAACAVSGAGSE